MTARHDRDGPGARRRGRGNPSKMTSTPELSPSESNRAFSYATRTTIAGQAAPSSNPVWDSGWEFERSFRVRTTIGLGPDGGLRRRWAEGILFGPDRVVDVVDEDWFDEGDEHGTAGVREPRRDPGGSGSGSAALQFVGG